MPDEEDQMKRVEVPRTHSKSRVTVCSGESMAQAPEEDRELSTWTAFRATSAEAKPRQAYSESRESKKTGDPWSTTSQDSHPSKVSNNLNIRLIDFIIYEYILMMN